MKIYFFTILLITFLLMTFVSSSEMTMNWMMAFVVTSLFFYFSVTTDILNERLEREIRPVLFDSTEVSPTKTPVKPKLKNVNVPTSRLKEIE